MKKEIQKGIKIIVKFREGSIYGKEEIFEDITEIHWHFPSPIKEKRVAFESDILRTGWTYPISDIVEFEAILTP